MRKFVIAAAMVASSLPATAFAQGTPTYRNHGEAASAAARADDGHPGVGDQIGHCRTLEEEGCTQLGQAHTDEGRGAMVQDFLDTHTENPGQKRNKNKN